MTYNAGWLASRPAADREAFLTSLTPRELQSLAFDWPFWRREKQAPPPGDWQYWLIKAGRGFGKTRVGAEMVRHWIKAFDRANLIGATADDARDIMIEGESGILAICPPDERPAYRKSERKLVWPNGAVSLIFTADEPERLRGKQHEKLWADEMAAWRYAEAAWDQAMMGLRLGKNPQAVITTTPRPTPIIKRLIADPACVVTEGSTYENKPNLAPAFLATIIKRYEGTRLGRQELLAELLDDSEGSLWQRSFIRYNTPQTRDLARVVVAIDPAVTCGEDSDETGIIVAAAGVDGLFSVLDDLTCRLPPPGWARRAVNAYHHWQADRLVAEVNNGGDMVEGVIRNVDPDVSFRAVRATRGKMVRAEPIAALYEQGRVFHAGCFSALEDQMCTYVPGQLDGSPDRVDALVWALTELSAGAMPGAAAVLGQVRRRD